jgi:NAD(P)-dependent dehydrogenase (short-subunit alcohol dehydrogenase family)
MDTGYLSLEGKKALVTGGSRGIGKAIALQLADAGADVAISGRKMEGLEDTAAAITAMGRTALPVTAHNRKPEEIEAMVATVADEFGRIDILVNNAATNPLMAPLIDIEDRAWDVIIDTNLKGYFLVSRAVARVMVEHGDGGAILNMSSVGGVSPDRGLGVYCISKAGINMLTKALAVELGEYDIRVNAIAPGVVKTDFSKALWTNEPLMKQEMAHTPLQRISDPDEVARLALNLVSDGASYVTGQIIVMDGGGSV